MDESEKNHEDVTVGRYIKGLAGTLHENWQNWPIPDEGAMNESDCELYLRRKKAIIAYMCGLSALQLRSAYNFCISYLYRMVTERCLAIHYDGRIYGWRAIVPNVRIKSYSRKKQIKVDEWGMGAVGAMNALLDANPDLRIKFEKRILSSPKADKLDATRRPCLAHWSWFLNKLRELGYEVRGEWPFNTRNNGYQAVRRYIDKVLNSNPAAAAKVIGGPELVRKLKSGDGVDRPVNRPFQRIEMDAHKIDGRFCVMIPQISGGYAPTIIHRLWVIVLIEIITRVVIGYYLSFRKEVGTDDVLRAIMNALSVWHPKKLMFSDKAYNEGAGFPSSISEKFAGICWDETCIDGALAEKANSVRQALKEVIESRLLTPSEGFLKRRSLDDRPFIETFFRHLGKNGFQRISNTTGGNVSAKQGRNPDKVALAGQFQIEYASELLDVLIANYNATPHSSFGNRSPLQYLKFLSERDNIQFRHADPGLVSALLSTRKKCKVRGGNMTGRSIYVSFMNAKYHGDILSQRQDLVGKYIWVTNHIADDARIVQASTIDGRSLGILRAAPPWHKLPHSLSVRSAIASQVRRNLFTIASMGDAVETFIEFVENQSNKKLPIHPAYLEARKILSLEAEKITGKSMIEYSREKEALQVPTHNDNSMKVVDVDMEDKGLPMPARRLAASKD